MIYRIASCEILHRLSFLHRGNNVGKITSPVSNQSARPMYKFHVFVPLGVPIIEYYLTRAYTAPHYPPSRSAAIRVDSFRKTFS